MTSGVAAFEIRTEHIVHRPPRAFTLAAIVVMQFVLRLQTGTSAPWALAKLASMVVFGLSLLRLPRKPGAILRVDEAWVQVNGVPLVRRDTLTHVVARGGTDGKAPAVHLGVSSLHGVAVDVILATRADADALVSALGGGVHQSIARFSAEERSINLVSLGISSLVLVVSVNALFSGHSAVYRGPFMLGVILPLLAVMTRRRLTVGGDGVFIEPLVPHMAARTFVPFDNLDGVLIKDSRVSLIIDGKERRFGLPGKKKRKWPHAGAEALVARIEEAAAKYAARRATTDTRLFAGQFARAGVPASAWLARVRELGRPEGSIRTAALRSDALLGVVENPTVDIEARAGAAAALSVQSDDAIKARLRAAASVSAEPALRRVLDLATDPDASGMMQALDEVPPSRRLDPETLDEVLLDVKREAGDKTPSR